MKRVVASLISIAVVAAAGFFGIRYHDSLGSIFYEILWCLVVGLVLPRLKAARIAAGVLVATCILEFLQLWHPPFLEWLRSYFLGRTILGSYFDWLDFPYYFVGSALGWLWLRRIGHDTERRVFVAK